MAILVYSTWPPAAILDFCRSEIWRNFCFWGICFCLWTKFRVNSCNCDWVMAVNRSVDSYAQNAIHSFFSDAAYIFPLRYVAWPVCVSLLGPAVCWARLPRVSTWQSSDLVELSRSFVYVCRHFSLCFHYLRTSLDITASFLGSVFTVLICVNFVQRENDGCLPAVSTFSCLALSFINHLIRIIFGHCWSVVPWMTPGWLAVSMQWKYRSDQK